MTRFLRIFLSLALLVGTTVEMAYAQAPKPGRDWYEDDVTLGFKFKAPAGWGFVPAQGGSVNLIGKYVAPGSQFISDPKMTAYWDYTLYLVKIDRRQPAGVATSDDGKKKKKRFRGAADLPEWVDKSLTGNKMRLTKEKAGKTGKFKTTEYKFEGTLGDDYPVGLYGLEFELEPDLKVALLFNGPLKGWTKYERAFKKIAKSLKRVEIEERVLEDGAAQGLRAAKRRELEAQVAAQPGWELYETPNYFVVSSNDDKGFVKEILERLEAIRVVYEETYPPAMAEEMRILAAQREFEKRKANGTDGADGADGADGEDGEAGEDGADGADGDEEPKELTSAAPIDHMEMSRTSVVRVCKNRDEYISYGGSPRSAGYWHSGQKELVVFDGKEVGGRRDTWATLNHEAFHQYIYYFFGNLAPHSWYNEGNGDFYGGYQYKNGKFTLKPFDWRVSTIRSMIRDGDYVPLEELVRYSQPEYYGTNDYGIEGHQNYAAGWSLVWFLRTGKRKAKGWDDDWDSILDTYLRVLVETDDLDAAVDAAFEGVNWEKFEDCWKRYI